MPSLALELLRVGAKANWYDLHSGAGGLERITFGTRSVQVSKDGSIRPYFSNKEPLRRISAVDVMEKSPESLGLEGSLALIGVTSIALGDIVAVPTSTRMAGVEVHAQVVENLVENSQLRRQGLHVVFEIAMLLAGGIVLVFILPRSAPVLATMLYVLLAGGFLGSSYAAFRFQHLIDPIYPMIGLTIMYLMLLNGIWAQSDARRRQVSMRLFNERLNNARIHGELSAARKIQLESLPDTEQIPGLPVHVEVRSSLSPAMEVGGDFYDAFMLDDTRLMFVVADVSGKGIPASLFMALGKAKQESPFHL